MCLLLRNHPLPHFHSDPFLLINKGFELPNGEGLLGEYQRPEPFLGKCINIVVKDLGLGVPMCFLEDGRISTLGVHDDLIAILNIFDNYTHSSPAAEGKNINQLIFLLLIQDLQLNDVLSLLYELVAHLAGKVYEADFIRA